MLSVGQHTSILIARKVPENGFFPGLPVFSQYYVHFLSAPSPPLLAESPWLYELHEIQLPCCC